LIFYRHNGEQVEVLHIWHGARDIAALLSELD
jgi:plasmid stabilization system protein ParE